MKQVWKIFFLLLSVSLIACDKEEDEPCTDDGTYVRVRYQALFGSQEINKDSIYRNFENYPIKIEKVNFFTTGLTFIDGNDSLKVDKAFLYRNNLDESILSHKFSVDSSGDFSKFMFNVGVTQPENGSDPTTYGQSNHLSSFQAADMHWSWNTGYIFLKIEGKYDTIPGSTETPLNFAWHIGNDAFVRSVEHNTPISIVGGQTNILDMSFDIEKVFVTGNDTVFVKDNSTIHTAPGQEDVAGKIITNFANSIQVH